MYRESFLPSLRHLRWISENGSCCYLRMRCYKGYAEALQKDRFLRNSMLSIYSTYSREQRPFKSIEPGRVRMYVCGVTVYDYCHIGHGRTFVAFDVVRRWLEASGYQVTFVRNITDVDDKIIRRAAERGITTDALTAEFAKAMQEDMIALGCLAPTFEPRATEYIPQMLGLIEKLEEKGYAYHAADGDVDYSVRGFKNYGHLSGKSIDDLQSGARVQVGQGKRDPLDFVLWKSAKPGEPQWTSKWGCGRPGWHIECSAMAMNLLGETIDIHGGGPDLIFPHHENEIAQSEAATGSRSTGMSPMRRVSARRWTTTSIRRRRWRCSLSSQRKSTVRVPKNSCASSSGSAIFSTSSRTIRRSSSRAAFRMRARKPGLRR